MAKTKLFCADTENVQTSCHTGGSTASRDLLTSADTGTLTNSQFSHTTWTRWMEWDISRADIVNGTCNLSISINAISKADMRMGVEVLNSSCTVEDSDTDTTAHTTTGTKTWTSKSLSLTAPDRVRIFIDTQRTSGQHGNADITIDTDSNSWIEYEFDAGTTVNPEQAVLTWVAQDTTASPGGVAVSPAQASLAWVAQDTTSSLGQPQVQNFFGAPRPALRSWRSDRVPPQVADIASSVRALYHGDLYIPQNLVYPSAVGVEIWDRAWLSGMGYAIAGGGTRLPMLEENKSWYDTQQATIACVWRLDANPTSGTITWFDDAPGSPGKLDMKISNTGQFIVGWAHDSGSIGGTVFVPTKHQWYLTVARLDQTTGIWSCRVYDYNGTFVLEAGQTDTGNTSTRGAANDMPLVDDNNGLDISCVSLAISDKLWTDEQADIVATDPWILFRQRRHFALENLAAGVEVTPEQAVLTWVAQDVTTTPGVVNVFPSGDLISKMAHFYRLEEASGTRVDAMGRQNLIVVNDAANVAGKHGNAAAMYADADEIGDNTADLIGTYDYTIAFWYKANAGGTSTGTIIDHNGAGNAAGYRIRQIDGTQITAQAYNAAGSGFSLHSISGLTQGNWYLVIYDLDRDANDSLRIYDDTGSQVGTTQTATIASADGEAWNNGLVLQGSTTNQIILDSVATFRTLLTAGEITTLINGGNGLDFSDYQTPPAVAYVAQDVTVTPWAPKPVSKWLAPAESVINVSRVRPEHESLLRDLDFYWAPFMGGKVDNTPLYARDGVYFRNAEAGLWTQPTIHEIGQGVSRATGVTNQNIDYNFLPTATGSDNRTTMVVGHQWDTDNGGTGHINVNNQHLFSYGTESTGQAWHVRIGAQDYPQDGGSPALYVAGGRYVNFYNNVLPADKPFVYIVKLDGTQASDIRGFLNGREMTATVTSNGAINTTNTTRMRFFGRNDVQTPYRSTTHLVMQWNRALTDEEIEILSTDPFVLFRQQPHFAILNAPAIEVTPEQAVLQWVSQDVTATETVAYPTISLRKPSLSDAAYFRGLNSPTDPWRLRGHNSLGGLWAISPFIYGYGKSNHYDPLLDQFLYPNATYGGGGGNAELVASEIGPVYAASSASATTCVVVADGDGSGDEPYFFRAGADKWSVAVVMKAPASWGGDETAIMTRANINSGTSARMRWRVLTDGKVEVRGQEVFSTTQTTTGDLIGYEGEWLVFFMAKTSNSNATLEVRRLATAESVLSETISLGSANTVGTTFKSYLGKGPTNNDMWKSGQYFAATAYWEDIGIPASARETYAKDPWAPFRPQVTPFAIRFAVGGAQVSPEQAVLTWVSQDVTTITEVAPAQAVLAWTALDVKTTIEVAPAQAVLPWVAQDVTTTTTVSVTPAQAALTWVAQDTQPDASNFPAQAALAWVAQDVTATESFTVTPEQAVLTWAAQDTQPDASNYPQQASLSWIAQDVLATVEVAPAQAVLSWVAQDVPVDVAVTPDAAILTWAAQNVLVTIEVAPQQAALAWVAQDITNVGVGPRPAAASLAWVAQDITDIDVAPYPQQATLLWVAQNVTTGTGTSVNPQQAVLSWVAQNVIADVEVAPAQASLSWVASNVLVTIEVAPAFAALAWVAQDVTTTTTVSVSPQQATLAWLAQDTQPDASNFPQQATLAWTAQDVIASSGVQVSPQQAVLAWTALDTQTDQGPRPDAAVLSWVAQDVVADASVTPDAAILNWVANDVAAGVSISPEQAVLAWAAGDVTATSTVSVSPQQATLVWVAQDATAQTTLQVSPEQAVLVWAAQNVLSDVAVSPEGALLNWVAQDVSSLISGLDADGEIVGGVVDLTGGSVSVVTKNGSVGMTDRTTSTIDFSQ